MLITVIIIVLFILYSIGKNNKNQKSVPKGNLKKQNFGTKLQFLETNNIIDNTSSLDTLESRVSFALGLYDEIILKATERRFLTDCQNAIDEYKKAYYDKTLTDYEINLLVNPNLESYKDFVSSAIFKCFFRYTEKQKNEISKLKMNSAINRRKEDIVNKGQYSIELYNKLDLRNSDYVSKINQIITEFI